MFQFHADLARWLLTLLPAPSLSPVGDYVEMFRVHGDIHSFLYTGSPAMHSHVLNLVVQVRRWPVLVVV